MKNMTLFKYWALLILAAIALGILPKVIPGVDPEQVRQIGFYFIILVYIPLIAILRMRYLGITLKEYLLGLVPFYGESHRFRRLTKE
jgi:hypothetical protein